MTFLVSFLRGMAAVTVLSDTLRDQLKEVLTMVKCFDETGELVGDVSLASDALLKVKSDTAHRLHKAFTLLPGGILLTNRISAVVAVHQQDASAKADLDKCLTSVSELPLYAKGADEPDGSPVDIKHKNEYNELRILFSLLKVKASRKFKKTHADALQQVEDFFSKLAGSLAKSVHSYNMAKAAVAIASCNLAVGFVSGKTIDATVAQTRLTEAAAGFACSKAIRANTFLDDEGNSRVDWSANMLKDTISIITTCLPHLVGQNADITQVHQLTGFRTRKRKRSLPSLRHPAPHDSMCISASSHV